MKKYCLLICICFVLGCYRDNSDGCKSDDKLGETRCETNYNQHRWNDGFSYISVNNGNKELIIGGFDESCQFEFIVLSYFNLAIHKIVPQYSYHGLDSFTNAHYHSMLAYDIGGDYYDLVADGFDNWISIDVIDKDTTHILGRYNLAFTIADSSSPPLYPNKPDTLYYRNGTFTAVEED